MKNGSTLSLKMAILVIAVGVLFSLIRFPQTEGRAAHLDLIKIYADPLIIYSFIASFPFFVALYQAYKFLGYIDENKVFSKKALESVQNIKYCATITSFLIVLAIVYIRMFVHGDDPAGVTALGIITAFTSIVIATAMAVFQSLLQNAIKIKSENDLTV